MIVTSEAARNSHYQVTLKLNIHVTFETCSNMSILIIRQLIILTTKVIFVVTVLFFFFFLTNPHHKIKTIQTHSINHVNLLNSSYKCIREIKTRVFSSTFCFLSTSVMCFPFELVYFSCNKHTELNRSLGGTNQSLNQRCARDIQNSRGLSP